MRHEPHSLPTPEEINLLALLVAGTTDEDAARRLGWSTRTVRRRLGTAMEKLSARSRLQAGFILARSGWLDSVLDVPAVHEAPLGHREAKEQGQ